MWTAMAVLGQIGYNIDNKLWIIHLLPHVQFMFLSFSFLHYNYKTRKAKCDRIMDAHVDLFLTFIYDLSIKAKNNTFGECASISETQVKCSSVIASLKSNEKPVWLGKINTLILVRVSGKLHPIQNLSNGFIYLFIWGFTSLSTLYRSYHDG